MTTKVENCEYRVHLKWVLYSTEKLFSRSWHAWRQFFSAEIWSALFDAGMPNQTFYVLFEISRLPDSEALKLLKGSVGWFSKLANREIKVAEQSQTITTTTKKNHASVLGSNLWSWEEHLNLYQKCVAWYHLSRKVFIFRNSWNHPHLFKNNWHHFLFDFFRETWVVSLKKNFLLVLPGC